MICGKSISKGFNTVLGRTSTQTPHLPILDLSVYHCDQCEALFDSKNYLSSEALSSSRWVILGFSGDQTSLKILDRETIDVKVDIVSGKTFCHSFVVHLYRFNLGGGGGGNGGLEKKVDFFCFFVFLGGRGRGGGGGGRRVTKLTHA